MNGQWTKPAHADMVRRRWRRQAWLRIVARRARRVAASIPYRLILSYYQGRAAIMRLGQARRDRIALAAVKEAIRNSHIDVNAQCPACGHCQGEIRFSENHGKVLHFCKVCRAVFAESPIVKWDDWRVIHESEEEPAPMSIFKTAVERMAEQKPQQPPATKPN